MAIALSKIVKRLMKRSIRVQQMEVANNWPGERPWRQAATLMLMKR